MAAGVRNLDGMADESSGGVQQGPRRTALVPRGRRGGHADRTPTMFTSLGWGRGLREQWFRAPVRPCAAFVAMSAVATAGTTTCPCGGRRTVGGRTPVQGVRSPRTSAWPQDLARPRVPDTNRPDGGRSGSRGRTVSPLLALTRYNFLHPPQGRPCGRAATRREPASRPSPSQHLL